MDTNINTSMDKRLEKYSIDTRPYWEALQQHRLVIQQCADCGICRHYPQPMCAHCHSTAVQWRTVAGSGTVHSWTITHQTAIPGFAGQVPYVFATVDLPEGVRIAAPLWRVLHTELRLGLPVRLVFETSADGAVLPAFETA